MSREQQRDRKESRVVPALLIGTGAWYAMDYLGPVFTGNQINPLSALALLFLVMSVAALLSDGFWALGNLYDLKSARIPIGIKGTAGWVTSLDEVRHDLVEDGWAPYWGMFRGEEVMASYGANAVTIGVSGGGKGVGVVQPNILCIRESKFCPDVKGEGSAVLARALRKRGETVHILNVGGVFPDILGKTSHYNPLCIIADNYWRSGGLLDISDDIFEMCMQLLPEPAGSDENSDNSYFRIGSRELVGFAIQMCVLVHGYGATLGHVVEMLNDRESLLRHAQWACGRLAITTDDAEGEA